MQSLSARQDPPYWQIKSFSIAETIGDAENRFGSEDGSIERFAVIENDGELVSSETMAVRCDGNTVILEESTAMGVSVVTTIGCTGLMVIGIDDKLGF